jgi:hypothetical protein
MELILHSIEGNYAKLKDRLMMDETVNRASMVFKEAGQFGLKGGYVIILSGSEDKCKKALELAKEQVGGKTIELAKEVTGKEKEQILRMLKEEEEKAAEGFGNIFG